MALEVTPTSLEGKILPRDLRTETLARIRNRQPIAITTFEKYGDIMIAWWAHAQVLLQLCKEEGIHMTIDELPLVYSIKSKADLFFTALDQLRSQQKLTGLELESFQGKYQLATEIKILCASLGVTTLDPKILQESPQPLRTKHGPLQYFNRQEVMSIKDSLERTRPGKKEITILQSGSSSFKRFSDEDVLDLVQTIRKTDPNIHIRVITDMKLSPHEGYVKNYEADEMIDCAGISINHLAAYLSLNNMLYVTTDTFWSWLTAGCQAMCEQDLQEIVLYTLADSIRYGVPHATLIESEAVKNAHAPGVTEKIGKGMLSTEEYKQYWTGMKQSRGFLREIRTLSVRGIVQNDIYRVKEALWERLAK